MTFYPNSQGITMAMTDQYHEHKYDETQQCTLISNVFLVSMSHDFLQSFCCIILDNPYCSHSQCVNIQRTKQYMCIEQANAEVQKTKCLYNAPQNLTMHKSGQQRSMGTNLEVMAMVCVCRIKKRFLTTRKMLKVNIHGFVETLKRGSVFDA